MGLLRTVKRYCAIRKLVKVTSSSSSFASGESTRMYYLNVAVWRVHADRFLNSLPRTLTAYQRELALVEWNKSHY